MAEKTKGDLISDIAESLISGNGPDIQNLIEKVTDNISQGKKNAAYPTLTASNWSAIRDRFKKNVPETITKKWIADVLDITTTAAEKSILPDLQITGIINASGKTTDRAKALSSDTSYSRVCAKILNAVYPESLLDMETATKTAQNKITAWFKKNADASDTTAKRMTNFYLLLHDASGEEDGNSAKTTPDKKDSSSKSGSSAVVINVRIEFPSLNAAKQFDEILTKTAEQVHAKVENLK